MNKNRKANSAEAPLKDGNLTGKGPAEIIGTTAAHILIQEDGAVLDTDNEFVFTGVNDSRTFDSYNAAPVTRDAEPIHDANTVAESFKGLNQQGVSHGYGADGQPLNSYINGVFWDDLSQQPYANLHPNEAGSGIKEQVPLAQLISQPGNRELLPPMPTDLLKTVDLGPDNAPTQDSLQRALTTYFKQAGYQNESLLPQIADFYSNRPSASAELAQQTQAIDMSTEMATPKTGKLDRLRALRSRTVSALAKLALGPGYSPKSTETDTLVATAESQPLVHTAGPIVEQTPPAEPQPSVLQQQADRHRLEAAKRQEDDKLRITDIVSLGLSQDQIEHPDAVLQHGQSYRFNETNDILAKVEINEKLHAVVGAIDLEGITSDAVGDKRLMRLLMIDRGDSYAAGGYRSRYALVDSHLNEDELSESKIRSDVSIFDLIDGSPISFGSDELNHHGLNGLIGNSELAKNIITITADETGVQFDVPENSNSTVSIVNS